MIILTGGAGFIGSCFLKALNDNGLNQIIVVDRLGNSNKWKNLVGKRFLNYYHKDQFFEILFNNKDLWQEVDAIVHLGACSATTETDADYLMENNLNYSIELASFAAEQGVKFVYASSAATYGDGDLGYSDKSIDNLRPLNPYGFSKHLFDQWIIDNNLDTVFTGIKFFNVFGPNEYHKGNMSSMIYKSFLQIQESGKVKLFKSNSSDYLDGEQMRDFIYVKDCCDVMIKMINDPEISGIYNLGTGKARSWNDLIKAVFNAMDLVPNIEYIDMPKELEEQYQNFTQADTDKLSASPFTIDFRDLEDSVNDYVINYLSKNFKNL